MQKHAKVAYITAAGHSGSTLLDIITGSIPRAFSTGELTYLPWQIFRSHNTETAASPQMLCSCGSRFDQCGVWKKIIDSLGRSRGFDIFENPFGFRMNLLQSERYSEKRLSWSRIQRMLFGLALQSAGSAPLAGIWKSVLREPIDNNWRLYDTISSICDVDYVVDSSKSIYRLYLLHSRRPEHVRVLVLVRDVRGVACSALRLNRDPVLAAAGWLRQYRRIFSALAAMKHVQYLLVRYEDLAQDPVKERRRIAAFLGLPEPSESIDIDTREMHLVAGNGMRYTGNLRVKFDEAWRSELTQDMQKKIAEIGEQLVLPEDNHGLA